MAGSQHTCPQCHGVIHGTRRIPLEVSIKNHEASCPATPKVQQVSELGWSDHVDRIRQQMKYTDQNGNDVPLCVGCQHWRATDGDLCEMCAAALNEE